MNSKVSRMSRFSKRLGKAGLREVNKKIKELQKGLKEESDGMEKVRERIEEMEFKVHRVEVLGKNVSEVEGMVNQ